MLAGLAAALGRPSLSLVGTLLFATAVVSFIVPLRIHARAGVHAIGLDEAVLVGMLFVLPPTSVPAVFFVAATVAFLASGRGWFKAMFNAGQATTAAAAATAIFDLVQRDSDLVTIGSLAAAATATLTYNVVALFLLYGLFRRLRAVTFGSFLSNSWRLSLATWIGNTVVGLVLAAVATHEPWAVVFVAVVMVGLHIGYRGYAGVLEERARSDRLHEVTRVLADVRSPDAIEEFLRGLRGLFGADRAELLVDDTAGRRAMHRFASGGSDADPPASTALRRAMEARHEVLVPSSDENVGYRDALAAPLVLDDRTIGAVAVYDRRGLEPWDEPDAKLLASLANEAAVAVKNVELVASFEEESRKLRSIVTAASDGIVMVDEAGVVVEWNPAMELATGVSTDEALGRTWIEVLRTGDADGEVEPAAAAAMIAALSGRRLDVPVDIDVRRGDERRWLRCTFAPVRAEGERGAVLVARDVTSEVEVQQLKSDFIATVSHELRTPLTPLKGFIDTVAERWDVLTPDQIAEMFDAMSRQVDRLEALVGDLLVVADLDRGHLGLKREVVDLDAVVGRAIGTEVPPRERERVAVDVDGGCRAIGDRDAVTRVVRALLSNALKHTLGQVSVSVRAVEGQAVVEVTDSGPGIAPWDRERIFERFSRLGDHLTRSQGPGLGLSIARGLAERIGGRLELDSRVREGATFRLVLPAADAPADVSVGGPDAVPARD